MSKDHIDSHERYLNTNLMNMAKLNKRLSFALPRKIKLYKTNTDFYTSARVFFYSKLIFLRCQASSILALIPCTCLTIKITAITQALHWQKIKYAQLQTHRVVWTFLRTKSTTSTVFDTPPSVIKNTILGVPSLDAFSKMNSSGRRRFVPPRSARIL